MRGVVDDLLGGVGKFFGREELNLGKLLQKNMEFDWIRSFAPNTKKQETISFCKELSISALLCRCLFSHRKSWLILVGL